MGFRFDDGFVRHTFFGGRGVVFGGVFFGGPFAGGRLGSREGARASGGGQSRGAPGWGVAGRRKSPGGPSRPDSLPGSGGRCRASVVWRGSPWDPASAAKT